MSSARLCNVQLFLAVLTLGSLPSCLNIEDALICKPDDVRCCRATGTYLPELKLHFDCEEPENVTILTPAGWNRTAPFRLHENGKCFTRLPWNLCDYPNIVSINFARCRIQTIESLSCLRNLNIVDLSNNEIESLSKQTLIGLNRLQYLDLSKNRISYIETQTFRDDLHGLMIVFLDHNKLKTVEAAWMMSFKHSFCHFGLSHNQITHFSNVDNWHMDIFETYGPGYVDFSHNQFTTWFTDQLGMYGINDTKSLGAFLSWGFDLRNNPWRCDCKMYKFLHTASNFPRVIYRDYFEVYCNSPEHLKNTRILDVNLNQLVCNITEKCPRGCFCQDQPDNGYVLVDCRDGNIKRLPLELPDGNLKLIFVNNKIEMIEPRSYLARAIYVDVSRNDLKLINPEVVRLLQSSAEVVNVSHNSLNYLPEVIQNIQFSKLVLNNNPLVCDCNSSWMFSWLAHQDTDVSGISCSVSKGQILEVVKVDKSVLNCQQNTQFPTALSILLGVLAVLLLVSLGLLVLFRYEALIICHSTLGQFQKSREELQTDVYVSLEEESDADRIWVIRKLLPCLEQQNDFRLYFAPRDMVPGSVIVEEVINVLKNTHTALIVLSKSYIENTSKLSEFTEAYNIIVRQKRGRLIIVRSSEVTSGTRGYLNGFLRLKRFLAREDADLLEKIVKEVRSEKSHLSTTTRSTSQVDLEVENT